MLRMYGLDSHVGTGSYTDRDVRAVPRLVLLGPPMPHMNEREALWRIGEGERTGLPLLHGFVRCAGDGEK